MSVETVTQNITTANNTMSNLKSKSLNNEEIRTDNENDEKTSLHSYHLWLKEKQQKNDTENEVKVEEMDEDSGEDSFRVDAVLERGPSPPESDNSNSYEWSYEEQFKQLYELDNLPERKTFLDEYFEYMKARGTPVSRIPIMAKQILDLYQLYNLVVKHGGLVQVIRNKQWSKITKGLNLPTSITSAAFTLRTQYLKYLYPYECTMHNFSTPKELQAAIDSNRRDRFSTLYHTEPTMTPSRDERYGAFPLNGCDYPSTQPRHHIPHPALAASQMDLRYGLKRPGESILSKPYEKYNGDNSPKVIILQDGTPSMTDRTGKVSPPSSFHTRPRSPLRESELRTFAEMEAARRRSHPFPYVSGKEWDNEARHALEEDTRRRLLDESRTRNGLVCKDKNCNGIECQFARPDLHRHRPPHDAYAPVCSCAYCKDFPSRNTFSPTRRDIPRHHMDGASATTHDTTRSSITENIHPKDTNGALSPLNNNANKENEEKNNSVMTTLKMKLPDVRQGGNTIQISLEVSGIVYEGVIKAVTQNGISRIQRDDKLNGNSTDNEVPDINKNLQRV